MKLPFHIEDAKNLGKLLERYKDLYYYQVLTGVFVTYILYPCVFIMTDSCFLPFFFFYQSQSYVPYIILQ